MIIRGIFIFVVIVAITQIIKARKRRQEELAEEARKEKRDDELRHRPDNLIKGIKPQGKPWTH